jgi:hypothetical protein
MTDSVQADEQTQGTVVVTVDQRDIRYTQEQLGLTIDPSITTDKQILDAVKAIIGEELGERLSDEAGEYTFAVRRALNSNTIYVYPKPGFG